MLVDSQIAHSFMLAESSLRGTLSTLPAESTELVNTVISTREKGISPFCEISKILIGLAQYPPLIKKFCCNLVALKSAQEQDVAACFLHHFLSTIKDNFDVDIVSFEIDDVFKTVRKFADIATNEVERAHLALREPLITLTDGELAAHQFAIVKLILNRSTNPPHDIASLNTGFLEKLADPIELEKYYSQGHHYIHFQHGRVSKGHLENRPSQTELNIYEAFAKMVIPPVFEAQDQYVASISMLNPATADELIVDLQCVSELDLIEQLRRIHSLLKPLSTSVLQSRYLQSIDCTPINEEFAMRNDRTGKESERFFTLRTLIYA